MPLKTNKDGSYHATWVPSASGSYTIQVFIDGRPAGTGGILIIIYAVEVIVNTDLVLIP